MPVYYAYEVNECIDFWDGWRNADETDRDGNLVITEKLLKTLKTFALKNFAWYGDVAYGPYWCPLPVSFGCEFVIAWKQDKSGRTFVFSPRELPWFSEPKIVAA